MKSNIKKALAFGAFIFGLAISTSHVFCGKNAGVFPFAKWNGEIYFLIGKDKHRGAWSDFGGLAEDGERTNQTANRKFREKTKEFFGSSYKTERGTPWIENFNQSYRTYLVEIRNNINTEDLKAHINGIRRKRGRSVQTEKTDFAWVSLRELVHKIAGMDRWNSELKLQVIRGSLGNGTEPEEEVKVAGMFSRLLHLNSNIEFFNSLYSRYHLVQDFSRRKASSIIKRSRLASEFTDFFRLATGISESSFRDMSLVERQRFLARIGFNAKCGTYHEYAIEFLKNETGSREPFSDKGFFKILRNTKVQDLMRQEENAVFQVASNVNALEGGMGKPEVPLNDMQCRAVQGETLAMCTFFGSIQRKYLVDKFDYYGGRSPINLLSNNKEFTVNNEGRITKIPRFSRGVNPQTIKIGYQRDTEIVFEGDEQGYLVTTNNNPPRKIDLAISFALDLNTRHSLKYGVTSETEKIAKKILNATYEGAIRSAFYNNRQRVFLTLVGGGSFCNKLEWIRDAISRMKSFIVEKNMQIFLVIPSTNINRKLSDLKREIDTEFTSYNQGRHQYRQKQEYGQSQQEYGQSQQEYGQSQQEYGQSQQEYGQSRCYQGQKRGASVVNQGFGQYHSEKPIILRVKRVFTSDVLNKILVGEIYDKSGVGEKIKSLGEVKMKTNGGPFQNAEVGRAYFFHSIEEIFGQNVDY